MADIDKIFDNDFSGILNTPESNLPDYLASLAEEEKDFEVTASSEQVDLSFGVDPLTRSADIGDNQTRVVRSNSNKVNQEISKAAVSDKKIEQAIEDLLSEGIEYEDIEKRLYKKFPKNKVKKFFEASKDSIISKWATSFFNEKEFDQINSTKAIKILNRYANRGFIAKDIISEYVSKLANQTPQEVLTSFAFNFKANKVKTCKDDLDNKVSFKRDIDHKEMKERIPETNKSVQAKLKEDQVLNQIHLSFKTAITSGSTSKEAHAAIRESYKPTMVEKYYEKFARRIERFVRFADKRNDSIVDKISNDSLIRDKQAEKIEIDEKEMMYTAFNHLSNGQSLEETKANLKKSYGLDRANLFLKKNNTYLERHYGQLGYVFLDSNIYKNCSELESVYKGLDSSRKELMLSIKANKGCTGCDMNCKGMCKRTNLMISNHPMVRSARAAKKVFSKAASMVPKSYVDEFTSKLQTTGNAGLVSEFTLGMKSARENEKIKTASGKDTYEISDSLSSVNAYNTEVGYSSNASKIVDDILNEEK